MEKTDQKESPTMTNKELAAYFNISPAAFSLIVNHKPGVSEATRQRVLARLQEMGYSDRIKKFMASPEEKPAQADGSVQTHIQTHNICFVIFKRDGAILDLSPFFMLLIENIEKRARKYGYSLLISTLDRRYPMEEQMRHLNELDADCAIIFATEMREEDTVLFDTFQKPYLFLDHAFPHLARNTVSIDNEMGTWQAVEYLVHLGHRKIGYLAGQSRISSFQEREEGYRKALRAFGLELEPEFCYMLRNTEEGSYQDFLSVLEKKMELPTALVSDDDIIAAGVTRALKENGLRIPEDISVIGYNDRPVCTISSPPLTTVSVSKYSFAVEAVDTMMSILDGIRDGKEYRTKKIRTATGLLIRNSAGKPRE